MLLHQCQGQCPCCSPPMIGTLKEFFLRLRTENVPGFVSVAWSPYFTRSFRTPFSLFLFPGLLFPLLLFPLPSLFTFHFSSLLLFPPSLFPIPFFIFSSFPNVIPPSSLPYSFPSFPSLSLSFSFPIPFSLFLFSIPTFPFSSFTFFLSRSFLPFLFHFPLLLLYVR